MGADELGSSAAVKACPHDCPDTCAMEITVENGVAVEVRGPQCRSPRARCAPRSRSTSTARYRIACCIRYGVGCEGQGQGRLERISWDEALDEIAAVRQDRCREPAADSPCSYAGTMGLLQYMSMDRRFFNRLGASLLDRTLCSSAGKAGMKITLALPWNGSRVSTKRSSSSSGARTRSSRICTLVAPPGGKAPRCQAGRHRSVAQPDRREVPPAHPAAARHRRRARARDDARHYRGAHRPRLRRASVRGFEELSARVKQYSPEKVAQICGIGVTKS